MRNIPPFRLRDRRWKKWGRLLEEVGYVTPRGHEKWWPAQVAHVLEGRLDGYYCRRNPDGIWVAEEHSF